jgi:glycosyltransferase involved in cell wall biosynthesis
VRIAHLGSKGIPSKGGTERVVEALATRQAAAGHQVTVYGSRLVCESAWVRGVRVIALPAAAHKYAGPVLLQLAAAGDALARGGYDVLHLHGAENGFVLPLLRLRYPVVTTNHGPAYLREKWSGPARRAIRAVDGLSVRLASRATAVSSVQADQLGRRYGREVAAIPNGIDADEPVDEAAAREFLTGLGLEPGGFLLFAAARVDPTKGCHTLVEALSRLRTGEGGKGTSGRGGAATAAPGEVPPLLVVGDLYHAPGYEEQLRALARGLPVTFVPRLDDKATLLGLLRAARLFIFPSTVEAMSMMLLEALCQEAPTLASDIPENTSILPPGFPTFRADDAGDLAVRLAALLAVGREEAAAAAAAAAWVRGRFAWDAIAPEYERVYWEACDGGRQ